MQGAVPTPSLCPGVLFGCSLPVLAGVHSSARWEGASLAVLRGRGSLSVFLLLLLHLLDDFPDLALCSLERKREAAVRGARGAQMCALPGRSLSLISALPPLGRAAETPIVPPRAASKRMLV